MALIRGRGGGGGFFFSGAGVRPLPIAPEEGKPFSPDKEERKRKEKKVELYRSPREPNHIAEPPEERKIRVAAQEKSGRANAEKSDLKGPAVEQGKKEWKKHRYPELNKLFPRPSKKKKKGRTGGEGPHNFCRRQGGSCLPFFQGRGVPVAF